MALIQTATPGSGMDFFGGAKVLMDTLQGKIIAQMQALLPVKSVFNIIWIVMLCIFLFHFAEAFLDAAKRGSALSYFGAIKQVLLNRGMRMLVYLSLAVGSLMVLNGGMAIFLDASDANELTSMQINAAGETTAENFGGYFVNYLGTNDTRTVTDPATGGTKTIMTSEAPCMQSLDAAILKTDQAINGMAASQVFDEIGKQVTDIMNTRTTGSAATSTAIDGTALSFATVTGGQTLILYALQPILDGFFWVVNWFTFIWAQWTLCRTLLLQALFIKLAWHIGLYFLPIFIMLGYFRATQGFLIRLVTNFVALMIAAYVVGALGQALFASDTWLGNMSKTGVRSGGIIQAAFSNVTLGGGGQGFTMGSFPWLTTTYATQIARGQLVWLMGAVGIMLGQIYEMVRGVLDGSFRSFFQPGTAGRSTPFGGQ